MKGAVACGNLQTAKAALEAFLEGGNAFDAAVAASLAATVAESGLSGLAGGGLAVAFLAESNKAVFFDFFVNAPGKGLKGSVKKDFERITLEFTSSTQDFYVGAASVAVPGTPMGLKLLKESLGRLPWEKVVAPAVRLAREGFEVDELQAACFRILKPIFERDRKAFELFYPGGCAPKPGTRLKNPALGEFLEGFPESVTELYRGKTARELSEFVLSRGGLLTERDLREYEVRVEDAFEVRFGAGSFFTVRPPHPGGELLRSGIEVFEKNFSSGRFGGREHLSALTSALLSQERARKAFFERLFSKGTTHISTADEQGNLCGITFTFGEGSGVFYEKLGLFLNNIMGEEDLHPNGFFSYEPGERIPSMMSPGVLELRTRRFVMGSGGSKRIRSALLQVVINLSYLGMEPEEAVASPRIHYEDGVFQVEPGFSEELLEELVERANAWPEKNLYFGGVHIVGSDLSGCGDPRRAGTFAVVTEEGPRIKGP